MFSIGQLAKKAKVSNRTLRYYEELSLIVPLTRGENRYRYYDETHLQRLTTIRSLQVAGFALKDIIQTLSPDPNAKNGSENGKGAESGLQIANKVFAALSQQKQKLVDRQNELNVTIDNIQKSIELLKECFGCKSSHSLEACTTCQSGPTEVREYATHQLVAHAEKLTEASR